MSPTAQPATPTVGRPRDAALDANVLRAAMELLGEGGIAAVTMEAVAQRAGAGKASLYRRWKSKDELLADALTLHSPIDVEVDTGSLRGDLIKLYEHYYGIGNHVMQAAMQEMLGNVRQHLAWTEKVAPERLTARRAKVRALFERAVARGEIAPPADMDLLLDLVPAMVLYRYNTRNQKVSRASIARFVDGAVLPLAGWQAREPRP
ncbi:TetR/AcrR family transcriptional regulator [Variovorax sp. J22P271]|uniref:TetR/AcrR family transcriptional regulator n=1 Tax=Variovorax davisae TaxID=3053515 RepID=UPI002576BF71|nr:TetR/AcrR family transcriptional regulator [Variovorax sp. J22P271]MDM0036539.1 TetR/AcrR family transcriptional regulator [Variovorax sp. J22P271]